MKHRVSRVKVKARHEPAPFKSKTANETSWKPETSWLIVLKKENGLKDMRNCKGSYADAVVKRDEYMFNSLYASAWIIEQREKSNFAPRKQRAEDDT